MAEDRIIAKIRKCMALSASANEHEAAAALRQAAKLMEAHGITDGDLLAAEASERAAQSGAKRKPSTWESVLASKVAEAFGCRLVFAVGGWYGPGEWRFIGCGAAPEVSHYAFKVMHRQAVRARREYIRTRLRRCKSATKTRRADLFSEGWVAEATRLVERFAGMEGHPSVDAYLAKHYPALGNLSPRNRNDGKKRLSSHEWSDYASGRQSGSDAQLNRGMGNAGERQRLESM